MSTSLATKRMTTERKTLERSNEDYIVHFPDDANLLKFNAYIVGVPDSLYRFKFVKIQFDIPDDYPFKPPKCKFIQHYGGRIHPNLYVDGTVCLSILGTWEGEPWALAMTCETVLVTIRSLLDNKPYLHEPGREDDPKFNSYVQYGTWRWLLMDYLLYERATKFRLFLSKFVIANEEALMAEFDRQAAAHPKTVRAILSIYDDRNLIINYNALRKEVQKTIDDARLWIAQAETVEREAVAGE